MYGGRLGEQGVMNRHMKTFKMGGIQRFPAKREQKPVVVEYGSASAFLREYESNFRSTAPRITTTRSIPVGTVVDLALTFPGLGAPIVVHALVQQSDDNGMTIAFLAGTAEKLASLVEQVRNCDPDLVTRPLHVLIVDDNHHLTRMVQQGLMGATRHDMRDLMFVFDTADNGAEGLELLKSQSFDLAIVDVYLPILDGPSLIAQARGPLGLELPIISVSAGGDTARKAAFAAGASAFLDKPVRLREVATTLRRVLSEQSAAAES